MSIRTLRMLEAALAILLAGSATAADDDAGRLRYRITECRYSATSEIVCDMHVFNETGRSRRVGSIGARLAQLQDESSTPFTSTEIDLKSADGTDISQIALFPKARVYYRISFQNVVPGIRRANILFPRYGGLEFPDIPVAPYKPAPSPK